MPSRSKIRREDGKDIRPVLFVFSGLPGVGKTTAAEGLSGATGAVFLRVDTIEQGLRDLAGIKVEGEGYRLAYRIAADNLRLGHHVVADSCNPVELTRKEWINVAEQANARVCNIEVICTDPHEHRSRVEARASSIQGLQLPAWSDIRQREYHAWANDDVIRLDTAGKQKRASLDELMARVVQGGFLNT